MLPPGEDPPASPSFWGLAVSTISASFPIGALPGGSGPFEAPVTSLNFMADICNDPVSSIPRGPGSHRPSGGPAAPSLAEVCPRSFSLQVPTAPPHPPPPPCTTLATPGSARYSSVRSVSLSLSGQPCDGKNSICPLLCPVPSTPKQGPDTCRTDERRVHHKMNFPPPRTASSVGCRPRAETHAPYSTL